MAFAVALMMLLSTGGNLLIGESEAEGPVQESQEQEVDSVEIYVRHSKPRKIRPGTVTSHTITNSSECGCQLTQNTRGHQLVIGHVLPLLC